MGMAASQARYLALVARKSNCEYEGQQINQARTVLSNQSANLFNQMLGLSVPVPPSTQDYTKTQYSFSDGVNSVTMDSWNQLATPEEDYNYSVTYHYNADVYTGSQKKMNDPQVQFSGSIPTDSDQYAAQIAAIQNALTTITAAQTDYDDKLADYKTKLSEAKQLATYADNKSCIGVTGYTQNDDGSYEVTSQTLNDEGYGYYTNNTTGAQYYLKDGKYYNEDGSEADVTSSDVTAVTHKTTYKPYSGLSTDVKTTLGTAIDQLKEYGALDEDFDTKNVYYDEESGSFVFKSDIESLITTGGSGTKTILPQYYIDTTQVPTYAAAKSVNGEKGIVDTAAQASTAAKAALDLAQATYDAISVPDYIGNCQLTALSELSTDQMAEIAQVIKDMQAQNVDTNITKCFSTNDGTYDENTYSGGLYSFKLNGTTYYTTYYDLAASAASGNGINNIDDQDKLAYYNASYVSTKIEKTEKALLETDGNGRFTSIRLGDDTVTYTLNMETVTDDDAYQDAMNQYYYENAQYDKEVQDINAKTSLIQQEDQQLELRLKQLDTEQNALSTEIDAVSKVVKDNIEDSFKTFGG